MTTFLEVAGEILQKHQNVFPGWTGSVRAHLSSLSSSLSVSLATVLCLMDLLLRPAGGMDRPRVGTEGGLGGMERPRVGTVARLETYGELTAWLELKL